MAANTGAEAHQEGGGEPAPDAGAPTAGGERGAMPASNGHPSPKIEAAKAVLKVVLLLAAVQGAQSEGEENKGGKEEESFKEFEVFMVVFNLLVVVMTMAFQWMWKVGVSRVFPSLPTQEGEDGRSHPAEVDAAPQAEEPEVPEELSSATTSESSSSSQEEDPLGVQRAIQDINREEAELWNRIRADPACFENEYNEFENE